MQVDLSKTEIGLCIDVLNRYKRTFLEVAIEAYEQDKNIKDIGWAFYSAATLGHIADRLYDYSEETDDEENYNLDIARSFFEAFNEDLFKSFEKRKDS
jgi:hypothetical protein